ncbi:phage tail protein [Streptomyces sp. 3214.6]|uniref:phage tail protein n=1 Tax=Streptomyces sp. 3214.6 TaxID=1882757 RepID=UPI00090A1A10|nr:phage tail protein [Streptomyces sp. 3214.6]SHH61441.1 phage tail protein domain-containing protein [Streptomyces sp. 3214.6]
MRAAVAGLPTPHPLIYQLPAVYLGEDFIQRFLAALDDVLAPVLLTIDNLPAHLDPRTAPEDFLAWLGEWVAVGPAADRPAGQRRAAVLGAVERHRRRGTRGGLDEAVRLEFGTEAEIEETGGTSWSETAHSPLPGPAGAPPRVSVRVRVADPDAAGAERLRRLVAGEVPAHVGYDTELLPLADAS